MSGGEDLAARRRKKRKLKIFNISVLVASAAAIVAAAWFGARGIMGWLGDSEKPESQSDSRSEPESAPVPEPAREQPLAPVSQPVGGDTVPVNMRVEEFLSAARRGNRADIQSYVDYDALFGLQEGQAPDWILGQVLMRMRSEIVSVEASPEEEPDSASVVVKFTNIDMGSVLPEYYRECMELEYNNGLLDEPLSAAELELRYNEIFAKIASAHAESRVEKQAALELAREGGAWQISASPELGDAMLGGYMEARRQMSQGMGAPAQAAGQEPAANPESSQEPESSEAPTEEASGSDESRPEWASPDDVIGDHGMVVPRE
jgi:hypothetical protein